ncbi:MAG: DUF4169 family protein [Paracoccaceae bacterium]
MAKLINLRAARKAAVRQEAAVQAAANAARFGRSKADKAREAQDLARASATLDGARRESRDGAADEGDGKADGAR